MCFFLSNFFKKERKISRTPQTYFLMLEAKQINSSVNPLPLGSKKIVHFLVFLSISSSWKWQNEGHHLTTNIPCASLDYKHSKQGRDNWQQFDKYAMSKGIEFWLLSSFNYAYYNKALSHFWTIEPLEKTWFYWQTCKKNSNWLIFTLQQVLTKNNNKQRNI